MKYLILLLVVFGFAWYWRHNREQSARERQRPTQPPPSPKAGAKAQEMIACALCGTHVPEKEATQGAKGVYCSPAHRAQQEP